MPEIENSTHWKGELLFVANGEGRPIALALIKATFRIAAGGRLELPEKQTPLNFGGEYWGDPDRSSYKYEPESGFFKPATDVVLIGHACAPHPEVRELDVTLRVGPLEKTVRVIGDRYWIKALGITSVTRPDPFEKIPLVYERAYGGWDRSDPNPKKHRFEPRNPVGTGFQIRHGKFEEGLRLQNLEEPGFRFGEPAPTGFGFTSPHWQPRAKFAGTYDEKWMKDRMPLLPTDFDPRFFNAASPGLIAPGYLVGNEPVLIENATPSGRLAFYLPGIPPPKCRVVVRGKPDQHLDTKLDTVIINTDENLLFLIWRANLVLRRGPEDVSTIEIKADGLPESVLKKS